MWHKHKALWMLLLIAGLSALPFVAAKWVYTHRSQYHFTTTNHGKLIIPVKPLAKAKLFPNSHQWTFVYASANCCPKACQSRLYELQQMHKILRKDAKRVENVLLVNKACKGFHLPDRIRQVQVEPVSLSELHQVTEASSKAQLYVMDPKQNLIMSYQANQSITDIYLDLKHLLKGSQIG